MRLKNKLLIPAPAGKKPRRRFSPAKAAYYVFLSFMMFLMTTQPVYATDVWAKATEIMKDVYNQIVLNLHRGRYRRRLSSSADDELLPLRLLHPAGLFLGRYRGYRFKDRRHPVPLDHGLGPAALSFADFNSVMLAIIGVCANGAVALIALIVVLVLAWNYLKLLLEAAERYVLLGHLSMILTRNGKISA